MKNKITKALSNPFNRKKTYELNPAAPDSFVHPSDHDQLYKEKAFTPEATPQLNKMDYLNLTSENKPANATYTKSRKVGITLNPGTPNDQIDARNIAVNAAKSLMQDNRERAESVTSAIQRQRSYSSEIIGSQGVLTIKNDLLAPDMTTKNASNWSLNNLMVQTEKSARKVATNVIKPARNLLLANRADASKNSGCTVSIFLIEGSGLPGRDRNGYSDPFCEFKIASEAYTSKVIWHSLNPQWRERFSLNYNENENDRLRIKVWDRDRIGNDFIGHATIYLASYEPNTYHNLWLELDEGNGKLHLAMHITPHNSNEKLRNDVDERAHTYETIQNLPQLLKSVGKVKLQIIRAWGLASKDLNGKSDPFCVIRLVEQEERTKTAYRTLNPCWGETFELEVVDVHSVLTITVLDEDKYHEKSEFLGKVAIPLLSIANNYAHGSWIMLKDETLLNAAKGALFVRIGLEYNHFTAAVRTFLKKPEENTDVPAQAFRPIQFKNDVTRVQEQADPFLDAMYLIKLSLTWKKPLFSFLCFVAYMLVVQYIQVWMLPLVLVVLLLINMLRYGSTSMASFALRGKKKYSIPPPILHTKKKNIMKRCRKKLDMKKKSNTGLNDTEKSLEQFAADYKRKKSPLNHRPETNLINMLQSAQEAIINVQEIIAEFADGVERVYNLFKFKSPWLSFLAMLVLTTISLVLYIIPFRTLLHIIGIHKFSKRLIRPNAPVSDEIYNFILRSLTDLEVRKYAEVPVPKESGFDESCPFEEFLRLHEDDECSSNENLNEIGDDEAEDVLDKWPSDQANTTPLNKSALRNKAKIPMSAATEKMLMVS